MNTISMFSTLPKTIVVFFLVVVIFAIWMPLAVNADSCLSDEFTGSALDGNRWDVFKGADYAITVPMLGMVESLNVSVAAAVILFEAQRQRELKGMYNEQQLESECFERLLFEATYPRLSREMKAKGTPYPQLDDDGEIIA